MAEQITFETHDFADNPEPRCPCVLLLDVSGSMTGRPLDELNVGLTTFKDELTTDSLAMKRVEIGIVTFGLSRSHYHLPVQPISFHRIYKHKVLPQWGRQSYKH